MKRKKIIFLLLLLVLMVTAAWGGNDSFTREDRELLIELKTRMVEIDKRFDQIDKRFEQISDQFGQMMSFIWVLAGIFVSICAITISRTLWDRRTMIRPFEEKTAKIEEKVDNNKAAVTQNEEHINQIKADNEKLVTVLKEYAKKDRKFAEVIKQFNLF